LRQAVRELRFILPGRVFLGGQSYGGRQASMLAADDPGLVDGLLLLSYPLHPPGRPQELRTDHFSRLRTPALFAHGTFDPFGSLDEIEAARPAIAGPTAVVSIAGAGHGLGRGTRAPWPAPDTIARIVAAFVAFMAPSSSDAAAAR
jgi:predicted alpha/beta-hydrolase family hydrolase